MPPFDFEYGKGGSRHFELSEFPGLLPEGVDLSTIAVRSAIFGGKTGPQAQYILEQMPNGIGYRVRIEEKKIYQGSFTFDVVVSFGE